MREDISGENQRGSLRPQFFDNEPPGSDGDSGKVARDGKVAMAREGDSESVTRAMIAAGISQLLPMNMSLRCWPTAPREPDASGKVARKAFKPIGSGILAYA